MYSVNQIQIINGAQKPLVKPGPNTDIVDLDAMLLSDNDNDDVESVDASISPRKHDNYLFLTPPKRGSHMCKR